MPSYAEHRLDIYDAQLYLATDKRQWQALRRRASFIDTKAPDSAGLAHFATWHPNDGGMTLPVVVLWINLAQHQNLADLADTLAHEASHAAGQLLDHVGHRPGAVDEPQAYLVGWLVRWMWDHCLPWIAQHTGTDRRQQTRA